VDKERVLLLRRDDRHQSSSIVNNGLHPLPQGAADQINNDNVGAVFVVVLIDTVATTTAMATAAMDEG
jgi:hypothetical protein